MLRSRMGSRIGWDGRGRVEWVRVEGAHVAGLNCWSCWGGIPGIGALL